MLISNFLDFILRYFVLICTSHFGLIFFCIMFAHATIGVFINRLMRL